jgi:hypothetical protein
MRGTNVPPTRQTCRCIDKHGAVTLRAAHQQTGSNAGSAALRVLRQGGKLRDTWHWRRRAAVAVWAQRVCELCADGRFRRGARRTGPLVPVCLSCVGEARNRPGLLAHGGGWARGAAARRVACARALWSVAYCRRRPLRQASARPAAHVLRRRTAPPARS